MERTTKQTIIFVISLIIIIILYTFVYNNFYVGDYIVQKQWLASEYNNNSYCDNCLWIEFSEGCNRYPVYYFEKQHEFDKRLSIGKVVNINFNGDYVKSVSVAKKYRTKCFQELDLTYYLGFFLIVFISLGIFTFKLYKEARHSSQA